MKKANLAAGVNLEFANGRAKVGFYTTGNHAAATVALKAGDRVLLQEKTAIGLSKAYTKEVAVPAGIDEHGLRAALSVNGKELVSYSPIRLQQKPMPNEVVPPPPEQIKTMEELYLAGQRIEQFQNPYLDPLASWNEALRRDPGEARVNTSRGMENDLEGVSLAALGVDRRGGS